jgi:hypothetical protein
MDEKATAVYRGLLLEIKYRVEAIDATLVGQVPLRGRIAEELCFLQLRMICELIAIGCLVLHGDLSSRHADLLKSYKADWIFNSLARLHPKFFPIALEHEDSQTNPPSWIHKKDGFLTREEMVVLYNREAGNHLHRGSARNILKSERPLRLTEIRGWRDKIVGLLNRHIVLSPDEKRICYFIMNDGEDRVGSNLFEAINIQAKPS